ncbi:MAG: hypothetical protein LBP35_04155 [Candidatus Ancillula trichonymphae]|nr:hypothetical protein [Candidatus Ancillula trichonymphae]
MATPADYTVNISAVDAVTKSTVADTYNLQVGGTSATVGEHGFSKVLQKSTEE